MSQIDKIRDAYERTRQAQANTRREIAPAWEALSLSLREAIIGVFFAGRLDTQGGK
jgi:hypothetical protein